MLCNNIANSKKELYKLFSILNTVLSQQERVQLKIVNMKIEVIRLSLCFIRKLEFQMLSKNTSFLVDTHDLIATLDLIRIVWSMVI